MVWSLACTSNQNQIHFGLTRLCALGKCPDGEAMIYKRLSHHRDGIKGLGKREQINSKVFCCTVRPHFRNHTVRKATIHFPVFFFVKVITRIDVEPGRRVFNGDRQLNRTLKAWQACCRGFGAGVHKRCHRNVK